MTKKTILQSEIFDPRNNKLTQAQKLGGNLKAVFKGIHIKRWYLEVFL